MLRTLLLVVALAACGSSPPPSSHASGSQPITPRAQLPKQLAPLVPQHGIYAAGGGMHSPPWRVVVDLDAKTIYSGSSPSATTPSYAPQEREATVPLTPPNRDHLMALADDVRHDVASGSSRATPEDDVVVIADGDNLVYIHGYGPIHRPTVMKLIEELRAAGAL